MVSKKIIISEQINKQMFNKFLWFHRLLWCEEAKKKSKSEKVSQNTDGFWFSSLYYTHTHNERCVSWMKKLKKKKVKTGFHHQPRWQPYTMSMFLVGTIHYPLFQTTTTTAKTKKNRWRLVTCWSIKKEDFKIYFFSNDKSDTWNKNAVHINSI